jgi:Trp operon repressor
VRGGSEEVVYQNLENQEDFDAEIKLLLEMIDNLQREDILDLLDDETNCLTERGKVMSEYLQDLASSS